MNLLFSGFFGSNVGDTAVTRGAVEMISRTLADEPIIVLAPQFKPGQRARWLSIAGRAPHATLRHWDLGLQCLDGATPPSLDFVDEILSSRLILQRLADTMGMTQAKRLFYGGGEHLFSYGNDHDDWNLLCRVLPSLIASKTGLQAICLPSTFGPFVTDFSKALAARFFAAQKLVLARDALSVAADPSPPGGILALDPAFYVPTGARTRRPGRRGPYSVGIVMRQEGIGLRVGASGSREALVRQREIGKDGYRAYRAAGTVIRLLREEGHSIRIFVQCDADRPLARRLYEPYESDDKVELVQPNGLATYIRELSHCDGVVTSRFHSAIFALMTGAVPLGLYFEEHGHKIPGLFEMLDIKDLCFRLSDYKLGSCVDHLIGSIRDRAGKPPMWSEALRALRDTSIASLAAVV